MSSMKLPSTLAEKTQDMASLDAQSCLVFGPSGCGKTLLAGSLSKKHKLMWFDLERGSLTLRSEGNAEYSDLDNIYIQPVYDTVDKAQAWAVFRKFFAGEDTVLCQKHGILATIDKVKKVPVANCPHCSVEDHLTYNVREIPDDMIIVIDSGTQLDTSIRSKVYGTKNTAWDENQKATYDQWNQVRGVWDIIGTTIQSSDLRILMIFHEAENKDGTVLFPIVGTKDYGETFSKYFNTVIHCHSRNKKYGWDVTAVDGKAIAKNRSGITGMKSISEFLAFWE